MNDNDRSDLIESRRSALECTECGERFNSWEDANDHAETAHGGGDA